MRARRIIVVGWGCILLGTSSQRAAASFHLMQIEQVIGGVNGDTSAQAIQFRMRSLFQNQVQFGRFVVRDAGGANPITLAQASGPVPNNSTGARVLYATPAFASYTNPPAVVDVPMTSAIPPSYLAAGTLTFEDASTGTVYWRLSWGGASYTGTGTGALTNDADGNFNPPFAGPLPSATLQALRFNGSATAPSTNNAADYSLTAGAAVFTNNAGSSFTVVPLPASRLTIDTITSPQTANAPFDVVVRARDSLNNLANVTANTGVSLSATGGATANLGGNTGGTIAAGTNTILISGVTYAQAETITITATRTSGDNLTSGESNAFDVQTPVPPCASCRGDVDSDNGVDGDDVQPYVTCVAGGDPFASGCGCADVNANGTFDAGDQTDFIDRLLGFAPTPGCP